MYTILDEDYLSLLFAGCHYYSWSMYMVGCLPVVIITVGRSTYTWGVWVVR